MHLLEKLEQNRNLTLEEWQALIQKQSEYQKEAAKRANILREQNFSNRIYVRGLIEFTNYCRNDCYYCGIRKSNQNADRYRLSTEQILECTDTGYELGFRTFVLQGGEDAWYTDERILELVHAIGERHPDCAITLSLGERNRDSYEAFFKAGADRYLLRHETADKEHYEKLHPNEMSFEHRMECLRTLKTSAIRSDAVLWWEVLIRQHRHWQRICFYTGITAAYGRDRTVCAASRDPVWKRSGRNRGTDPISAQPDPDVKTGCSASGNHSVRNH